MALVSVEVKWRFCENWRDENDWAKDKKFKTRFILPGKNYDKMASHERRESNIHNTGSISRILGS